MFLTKKNGHPLHKPKNNQPQKHKKALAGWDDDQEISSQQSKKSSPQTKAIQPINVQMSNLLISTTSQNQTNFSKKDQKNQFYTYYDWEQLNGRSDIDCQKRLVEDIIQPGGIRIKPNQSTLNQFLKDARSMDTPNIGSLLLSKLEVNYPFQVKAKSLYTIQFLSKKNNQYLQYFKQHATKIREFPEPEDNSQNYKKIVKSVLVILGQIHQEQPQIEQKLTFVDPGYYQQKPKSELSSFIQDNSNKVKKTEGKRLIIGPGLAKQKQQNRQETKTSSLIELNNQFQMNKKQGNQLLGSVKIKETDKPQEIDLLEL